MWRRTLRRLTQCGRACLGPGMLAVSLSLSCSAAIADVFVLDCEQLIDTQRGKAFAQQSVLVEGEQISAVGTPEEITERLAGAEVARISLGTCLPGLMDMHVHLHSEIAENSYIKRFTLSEADHALQAAHHARITLESGFTTVRNLGDSYFVTVALREAIDAGDAIGPRIYSAGKSIATTGGHADATSGFRPDLMGDPGPSSGVINGADEARAAVRYAYKRGADTIKITATGGVLSLAKNGQNPQFTADEIQAIVLTSSEYGMDVAAHAHGSEGMKRAVIAGVRSIEHGTFMDDEVRTLMKQNGTFWVPTMLAGKFVGEKAQLDGFFPDVVRPKAAAIGPVIFDTFAKGYKAGLKVAFGTDSGVSAHGDNAQEFALMVKYGMSPMEAIQAATLVAAELLREESRLGQIAPGFLADIVAVDGDPLSRVQELEQIDFVMKGGRIFVNKD